MIKVGKILEIMEIFLIFFDFWVGIFFGDFGFWGALGAARSTRMIRKCGVWGGNFLLVVWVFFVNLQKCYGSFFEKKLLRFF